MLLRRVTLSGQFSQLTSDSVHSTRFVVVSGLVAMAVDILVSSSLALFLIYACIYRKLVSPYERGFYCYEVPYLSNPFLPNTVSSTQLLVVSFISPFFVIALAEGILFLISQGENKLRKYFHSTTSIYIKYITSFTVATFIMETLKCMFARLRPHYLSVCKPNWEQINCTDPNTYIKSVNCMSTDMHRIHIGRQSFPSGHSTAAVLLFTFLFFYLKGIVNATGNKWLHLVRVTVLVVIGGWMFMVMTTRVTDHWHHPTDVLGGVLLGFMCAYIPLRNMHFSLLMACFGADDLTDFIRYECAVEAGDDDHCKEILKWNSRKQIPGGLPLHFRLSADSDSSSEEYSPSYLISDDCESTFELIQEQLSKKIKENDLLGRNEESKEVGDDVTEKQLSEPISKFFQSKDISTIPSSHPVEKSTTALLLERTDFIVRSDLAAYARFAAPEIDAGRKLLVFYPFAGPEPGNENICFSLTVCALCDIRVFDLVGLCCYEYARYRKTNNLEPVSHYHLLMAEENGEIDEGLPAIDGYRLLNELGSCWSTVALVKSLTTSNFRNKVVVVYTITGRRYEFFIESMNLSLRWLRDEAIKRRIEDEYESFCYNLQFQEYGLETIKERDILLDLDKPISSTASWEFLLIRANSSRGDFTPVSCISSAQQLNQSLKADINLDSSLMLEKPRCLDLLSKVQNVDGMNFASPSSHTSCLLGSSVAVFSVERIHRYKSNWNATLIIRMDGIELIPIQVDQAGKRIPLFLQSSPKALSLKWDCVGGVEITDQLNDNYVLSVKREVRIVWLAYLTTKDHSELQKIESAGVTRDYKSNTEPVKSSLLHEMSRRKFYNNTYWKTLLLKADQNIAWDIAEKMSDIIYKRNMEVHQIYKYSNRGTKKPKDAIMEVFEVTMDTSLKSLSSPATPTVRKVSKLVTSAVPTFHKLLSKHD
ncbi:unnamed protein product [Thelazia callipaeda]|uniref:AcidPPc domain-containing protein n=1 Tax=Thelazia callipaeda TaxID=103827 RepID=A0A0N5CXM5_THECL|nr:unnamed protein product [Thelazia callipaeda]